VPPEPPKEMPPPFGKCFNAVSPKNGRSGLRVARNLWAAMGNPEVRDPNSERTPKPEARKPEARPRSYGLLASPLVLFVLFRRLPVGLQPWQANRAKVRRVAQLESTKRAQAEKLRTAIEVALAKDDLRPPARNCLEFEAVAAWRRRRICGASTRARRGSAR